MKILSYIKGLDGSSYHRVYMPNNLLDAEVRTVANISEDDVRWCDVLHYNRHTKLSARFLDGLRKKYGFKIIVDTDDWWEVNPDHPLYEWWRRSNVSLQIREHLMMADAVTVTHKDLADIIPNSNVYIIPNAIDYGHGQFKFTKREFSRKLLYASTVMNYSNTGIISNTHKKLSDLGVEYVIAGHHESPFYEPLVKNLTGGVIPYSFRPWKGSEEYMSEYDGDIGILPSKNTKFNRMKSNLKVLEFAALKMPAVVSYVDPYMLMPVNHFSGESEFVEQVRKLVEDKKYRTKSANNLYDFCVANYNLRDYSEKRLKVYEKVKKHELK
jgi:glycosyltransferase involved in cell wall biosynthesis